MGSGPERRDPDPGECRRQAALGAPWAKRGSRAREGDVLRLALGPGTHTEQSEKLPWAGHGQAERLGLRQAPDKGRGICSADRTRVGQPGPTAQSPSRGQRDQDRPLINTSRVHAGITSRKKHVSVSTGFRELMGSTQQVRHAPYLTLSHHTGPTCQVPCPRQSRGHTFPCAAAAFLGPVLCALQVGRGGSHAAAATACPGYLQRAAGAQTRSPCRHQARPPGHHAAVVTTGLSRRRAVTPMSRQQ